MPNDVKDSEFTGAKIALIRGGAVLTYRRDNIPSIPYPNQWDLAGGGREGDETPEQCALRETFEEFGLVIDTSRIVWKRRYPHALDPAEGAFFMVAEITEKEIGLISFGDEGQYWKMMNLYEFLHHRQAVTPLQNRLRDFLGRREDLRGN